MRVVRSAAELPSLLAQARGEARSSFGDDTVFLEKFVERPRHIEVQILADASRPLRPPGRARVLDPAAASEADRGGAVARDRRGDARQDRRHGRRRGEGLRLRLRRHRRDAPRGGRRVLLHGDEHAPPSRAPGDRDGLRRRPREGDDRDQRQARRSRGHAGRARPRGHAIECRIIAEDPARNFMPSPGTIRALRAPSGPGVRYDGGVYGGFTVPVHYDPLLAKLITWGGDRDEAAARMARALDELRVDGVTTSIAFHRRVMDASGLPGRRPSHRLPRGASRADVARKPTRGCPRSRCSRRPSRTSGRLEQLSRDATPRATVGLGVGRGSGRPGAGGGDEVRSAGRRAPCTRSSSRAWTATTASSSTAPRTSSMRGSSRRISTRSSTRASPTRSPSPARAPRYLVRHGAYEAGRRARRRGRGPAARRSTSTMGSRRSIPVMPGKVVRLLVAAGDRVAADQGLVVVEAMKMENEIARAARRPREEHRRGARPERRSRLEARRPRMR